MKLLWIDTETGGLSPKDCDIVQISGIIEVDYKVVETFDLRLRPSSRDRVTQQALDVTGMSIDAVMAHPLSQAEGKDRLQATLESYVNKFDRADKFIAAGQNVGFDTDFLRALWLSQGDTYFGSLVSHHKADLISLVVAARIMGYLPNLPNLRLVSVCEALGIELKKAHDALHDITATRQAFLKLTRLIAEPVVDLEKRARK